MPQYKCKTINANGETVEGVFEANSVSELKHSVSGLEKHLISFKKISEPIFKTNFMDRFYKVKPQDLENFTSQLVVMLKAGVPLVKSLETLVQQLESDNFKSIVDDIKQYLLQFTAITFKIRDVFFYVYNHIYGSVLSFFGQKTKDFMNQTFQVNPLNTHIHMSGKIQELPGNSAAAFHRI